MRTYIYSRHAERTHVRQVYIYTSYEHRVVCIVCIAGMSIYRVVRTAGMRIYRVYVRSRYEDIRESVAGMRIYRVVCIGLGMYEDM